MKILVTGSNGFVGQHLVELLKRETRDEIIGLDRNNADITNYDQVLSFIQKIRPDQIYHLAGFASGAGKDKELIFNVNVLGTENILRALRETQSHIGSDTNMVRILLASTAYVYGNTEVCAREDYRTDAKSFYDQSKLEMEKLASKYLSSKLQVLITRATNHTGPGQKSGFVVPDLCQEIVNAGNYSSSVARSSRPIASNNIIKVGNLDAKRDLFDVRDCVRAYKIVMDKGEPGEIYNIGTGRAVSVKEILDKLIKISGKNINYKIDPARKRVSDIANNCVDSSKIMHLGWKPEIPLDRTLTESYAHILKRDIMK
jgi:GDP-4-dehydro-6-deoxy-D-mannose reductase